ncbi:MAG: FCD domain-containing protein [Firmicutes bacterium]|nr:FCD domain-containing protein [Bacillota bacterium]
MVKKLVKTNLSDQTFDCIQEEILKGTWKPGEKLPSETELAASLGVSRMTLRSAIQRCCAIGLTETRVGEGTFVRDFNLRSYFSELYRLNLLGKSPNEINDLRNIIQIGAVRLALENSISDGDIHTLEELNRQMEEAAGQNDMEAFHAADAQFHLAICTLCKNELMYLIYDAVEAIIDEQARQNVRRSFEENASSYERVLSHHRELLDSIRSRDIDRFIKAIMDARHRSYSYYSKP